MDNEQGKRRRKLINVPTGITKPSISIQTNTTQLHRSDSDENRRGNGLDYAQKPFKNSKVLTILDASNMDFKKNSEPIKLTRTLRERVELSDEVIHSMDVWRKMTRAPVRLEFRSPDWHCGILGSEIVQPLLNISCLNQNKYLGFLSELQLHSAIEERWKFPESENEIDRMERDQNRLSAARLEAFHYRLVMLDGVPKCSGLWISTYRSRSTECFGKYNVCATRQSTVLRGWTSSSPAGSKKCLACQFGGRYLQVRTSVSIKRIIKSTAEIKGKYFTHIGHCNLT